MMRKIIKYLYIKYVGEIFIPSGANFDVLTYPETFRNKAGQIEAVRIYHDGYMLNNHWVNFHEVYIYIGIIPLKNILYREILISIIMNFLLAISVFLFVLLGYEIGYQKGYSDAAYIYAPLYVKGWHDALCDLQKEGVITNTLIADGCDTNSLLVIPTAPTSTYPSLKLNQ